MLWKGRRRDRLTLYPGANVVNWPLGRVIMSHYASVYVRIITGIRIGILRPDLSAIVDACWKRLNPTVIRFHRIRVFRLK